MNGYISLGRPMKNIFPPSDWSENKVPIIAPLWADIETRATSSGFNIQQLEEGSKMDEVKIAFNNWTTMKYVQTESCFR